MLMFDPLLMLHSNSLSALEDIHLHVLKHQIHLFWLLFIPRGTYIYVVGLSIIDSDVQLVNQCVIIMILKDNSAESAGLKNKPGKTSGNVATIHTHMLCTLGVTAAFPNCFVKCATTYSNKWCYISYPYRFMQVGPFHQSTGDHNRL